MLILGIESSCDDTSVALVKADKNNFEILAEKTASQIDVHKKYGGVVPEIAGRKHAEKILPLIEEVMAARNKKQETRNKTIPKPDVIAVTAGPGLITGLIVGVEAARALSYLWGVPVVAVNHIEGHIYSVEISNFKFQISNKIQIPNSKFQVPKTICYPALALIASGGHTELIYIKNQGNYKIVGATRDDAAGECFDKVAKLLGFDYPGGPKISEHAVNGNPKAINFPRPMIRDDNFDFSFAGLKTSALYWLRDNRLNTVIPTESELERGQVEESLLYKKSDVLNRDPSTTPAKGFARDDIRMADFCASFEQAIVDVLVGKTISAAKKLQPQSIILAGGVSANKKLKETLQQQIIIQFPISPDGQSGSRSLRDNFQFPISSYSMDNAAMIAIAGYYHAIKKDFTPWKKLAADPNWKLA
jgi:N6-L-threonylcarbamoyladenine synthase